MKLEQEENSWLGSMDFTLMFFEITWSPFKPSPSNTCLN